MPWAGGGGGALQGPRVPAQRRSPPPKLPISCSSFSDPTSSALTSWRWGCMRLKVAGRGITASVFPVSVGIRGSLGAHLGHLRSLNSGRFERGSFQESKSRSSPSGSPKGFRCSVPVSGRGTTGPHGSFTVSSPHGWFMVKLGWFSQTAAAASYQRSLPRLR